MTSMGAGPGRVVLGFMLAAAFLSMWISNTAAAAMMLPIGLAVISLLRPASLAPPPGGQFNFGIALMLGIAYGSSIGGVATLIGTPPNAILAAAADELLGVRIGFLTWMWVGVPLALILLPLTWFLLVVVMFPLGEMREGGAEVLREERARLGGWTRGEVTVACVFLLTALAWVFREEKVLGAFTIPGIEGRFPAIGDATIAMIGALALFLIPVRWREGQFALRWEDMSRLPWGVLLLFGGGLSLARAMEATGLALWIGALVEGFRGFPVIGIVLVLAVLFVFLTELTSNTATATMAMPILVAVGLGMGIDPILLMTVAALSSSMAFMLPVATPPNAIVFASEDVTIPRMMRAGLVLNVIAIALVTLAAPFLIVRILGG
jgi:sodium-dependent dicarboxylate transporter 2/3/5